MLGKIWWEHLKFFIFKASRFLIFLRCCFVHLSGYDGNNGNTEDPYTLKKKKKYISDGSTLVQ